MKYLQYSYFCIIISKSNKCKRIEVVEVKAHSASSLPLGTNQHQQMETYRSGRSQGAQRPVTPTWNKLITKIMETYRSGRSQGAQRPVTPTWNKLITKIMETYRSGRNEPHSKCG